MLVIDDDEATRLLLDKFLSKLGLEARTFESAEDALPTLSGDEPEVLLLDNQLPGMSGIELCRKLRSGSGSRHLYIILMTANDDPERVEAALEAGANDYLVKPVTLEILRTRLIVARQKMGPAPAPGPKASEAATETERLTKDLQSALASGQMTLHYQPIYSLRIGPQVEGLEALLRWNHPDHGLIPPGRFIPLAERSTLIRALPEYALTMAGRQLRQWQRERPNLYMSVNISARDLENEELLDVVEGVLDTSGISSESLQLEVTETSAMQNMELAQRLMERIDQRGLRVAIDDFGTGYSSLAYLQNFRFHVLKIDRSFTRQIPENSHTVAITEALLSLAARLGVKTVVEGIETDEQFEVLKGMGFRRFQGYYFSRPVIAEEIPALLGRSRIQP